MQKRNYLILLCLCFSFNIFAQFTAKGVEQVTSYQFKNYSYEVTWIIEDGKYGLMNTKTREYIIKPAYEFAEIYGEEYSLVKKDGKYGFINHSGDMITGLDYEAAAHHNQNLIVVQKNDKYTFLDKTILTGQHFDFAGNPQFGQEYDMVISSFTDNYSIVILGGKYGYINDIGEEIIPPMYDEATLFEGQFAAVRMGTKWGAIDKANGKMIDFKYQEMKTFIGKNTIVRKGKKWGIVDCRDKVVVPIKFKYLSAFNNDNIAVAKKGKSWGVINTAGETVVDFEYNFDVNYVSLLQLTDGYLWLKKDDLWGTVDLNQNTIIPFLYSEIQEINGNRITVVQNGEIKVIDELGACLEDCPKEVKKQEVFYDFDN